MTASSAKQKKQFIVLSILVVLLVGVVYWQYLLSPIISECDELESKIEENRFQQLDVVSDIAGIPVYEDKNGEIFEKLSAETEKLFPIITNENADILILGYLNKSGLNARTLVISSGAPVSVSENDEEESKDTGIRIITASYEARGSYSSLRKFIEMKNSEPAIYITGITAVTKDDDNTSAKDKTEFEAQSETVNENDLLITIGISLYMYETPSVPEHFEASDKESETATNQDEDISDKIF